MEQTKQNEDTGNQCCNRSFELPVNRNEISDLRFYSAGNSTIIMVYVKDGHLYFSISFDCGQTWSDPQRHFEIGGKILDINITSGKSNVVVALTISDGKRAFKKAISGDIDTLKREVKPKECEKDDAEGELINVCVGTRPWKNPNTGKIEGDETVDFTYRFLPNGKVQIICSGHM